MMRETSVAGLVGVVVGDRQPADVRLHLAPQLGDQPLRRLREQLRQRERRDRPGRASPPTTAARGAAAAPACRLPMTSSIRNFVEAGSTSPDTRLTAIRTNPSARSPCAARQRPDVRDRAPRRSPFDFGRPRPLVLAEPARSPPGFGRRADSGSLSRAPPRPPLGEGDAARRERGDERVPEPPARARGSPAGGLPAGSERSFGEQVAPITHGKPVVRAIDVAPVFGSVRSKRPWTSGSGRPPRVPRRVTLRTVNSSSSARRFHEAKKSASVTARGTTRTPPASTGRLRKNPVSAGSAPSRRVARLAQSPLADVRRPSRDVRTRAQAVARNPSSVPTPGTSNGSTSERAGFVTTVRPSSTRRAGRVYSSRTSVGEKTRSTPTAGSRRNGRPSDRDHDRLERCRRARPRGRIARFERPGETPQSTIAAAPFRFRERVEREGVLRREGDVRDRLAAVDDRPQHRVAEEARHRARRRRRRPRRRGRPRPGVRGPRAASARRGRPAAPRARPRSGRRRSRRSAVLRERPRDERSDEPGSENGDARHGGR